MPAGVPIIPFTPKNLINKEREIDKNKEINNVEKKENKSEENKNKYLRFNVIPREEESEEESSEEDNDNNNTTEEDINLRTIL